jgi:hypothetical protein
MKDAVERQVRAYNKRDVDVHAIAVYRLDGDGLIDQVRFLR